MSGHHPYVHPGVRPPVATKPSTTLALVAILLAGLGALGAWIPFVGVLGLLMAIAGLVVGLVARGRARRGVAGGRTMATWAVVVGAVGILLGALGIVLSVLIVRAEAERLETTRWKPTAGGIYDTDGRLYSAPIDEESAADLERAVPRAIGETFPVGERTWGVVDVEVDAMDSVAAILGYEPRVDEQIVLATVEIENTGSEESGLHVQTLLVGGDGREYYGRCSMGTSRSVTHVESIEPGERHEGYLCFDMPAEAVPGARLVVMLPGTASDADAEAAVWTLR